MNQIQPPSFDDSQMEASNNQDNPDQADGIPRATSGGLLHEKVVIREAGKAAITQFLDEHNCFSVLRYSGKVVVFDTRIPIQLAFYALVEHGTCVPIT